MKSVGRKLTSDITTSLRRVFSYKIGDYSTISVRLLTSNIVRFNEIGAGSASDLREHFKRNENERNHLSEV